MNSRINLFEGDTEVAQDLRLIVRHDLLNGGGIRWINAWINARNSGQQQIHHLVKFEGVAERLEGANNVLTIRVFGKAITRTYRLWAMGIHHRRSVVATVSDHLNECRVTCIIGEYGALLGKTQDFKIGGIDIVCGYGVLKAQRIGAIALHIGGELTVAQCQYWTAIDRFRGIDIDHIIKFHFEGDGGAGAVVTVVGCVNSGASIVNSYCLNNANRLNNRCIGIHFNLRLHMACNNRIVEAIGDQCVTRSIGD
ncbi:hypothetical protein XMG59_002369 [Marinobacterium sp. xm-g-59]|nr:hypothetical protein [Marinobacterium sp. xm-g-59]